MNEKVNFNIRLEADPSKLAEQEAFAKMVDKFEGTDTYLASFFSEALLNWVTEQIDNDFPPDVKATIEGYQEDRANAITAMREANTSADAAEREHERAMKGKVAQIADLEKQVELYRTSLHKRQDEADKFARLYSQTLGKKRKLHKALDRMRGFMVNREKQWQFAMDQVLKRD